MLFWEILRVAFDAVLANRLRSALTMLGVIIGIAAVIAMMALGEGAQRNVESRLASLGANVFTVRPGQGFMRGVSQGAAPLTVEDAEALLESATHIARVSPELSGRYQVVHGAANASLGVIGVWPSYFDVNKHEIAAGRLFNEAEEHGRRRVAVLGALVPQTLGVGNGSLLVGQTIQIRGVPFEVIGILAEKGAQGWWNPDEDLYVPLATAQFRVFGTDRVRSISVQAFDAGGMDDAMAEVDTILRREHRIRPGEPADFSIRDYASLLSTMQETTKTFSYLLAGIAAISLVVGGIGIMNIMLVSVTERTREIGLRKALGARRRDILLQFLIEALVLCVTGGVLGVGLGIAASWALATFAGWNTAVSPEAIVLALGFSAGVGLFFGMWPARRASELLPIEALRYE